jgi:hypothetical protein
MIVTATRISTKCMTLTNWDYYQTKALYYNSKTICNTWLMENAVSIWCTQRRYKTHKTTRVLSNQLILEQINDDSTHYSDYLCNNPQGTKEGALFTNWSAQVVQRWRLACVISRCPTNPRRHCCRRWGSWRYKTSPHVWLWGGASTVQD